MDTIRTIIIILISAILFYSCNTTYQSSKTVNYTKIAAKIQMQTASQLRKSHQLQLAGSGGQMMHNIKLLGLSFNYHGVMNIANARKTMVEVVTLFLNNINNNEEIRPFLNTHPFEPENVKVAIACVDKKGNPPLAGQFSFVSIRKGIIYYYTNAKKGAPRELLKEESFSEAVQLLKTP